MLNKARGQPQIQEIEARREDKKSEMSVALHVTLFFRNAQETFERTHTFFGLEQDEYYTYTTAAPSTSTPSFSFRPWKGEIVEGIRVHLSPSPSGDMND